MPRHTRTKRSRSPPSHAHGSEAPDVAEPVSDHARRTGEHSHEHSHDDHVMTVHDDELRLMRHRLASAEAELAELRAKSNAIDTLLGEGFLETKEVQTALAAHTGVDHANYAESSRAAVASRALRRHVLKAFSGAASVEIHEIDAATFVRCHLPQSVVPRIVSEHVVAPYLVRDWLILKATVGTVSASSLSIVGASTPVSQILSQLDQVPQEEIDKQLSVVIANGRIQPSRLSQFLTSLCRRATLEELCFLGEWLTSTEHHEVVGLRTWCALLSGGPPVDYIDVVTNMNGLHTLLFSDIGRDQVFIPFAKGATLQRAGAMLNTLLSTLHGLSRSDLRNASTVFLTESMRDEFFLPLTRSHSNDSVVAAMLPSFLEGLLREATAAETALFLTPTFRDDFLIALACASQENDESALGTLVCRLCITPTNARASLCTADFRDRFFIPMVTNEFDDFECIIEALVNIVVHPAGGWGDEIDPDPSSVFATPEFTEAFIVPAISRLKELAVDDKIDATRHLALLLGRFFKISDAAGIMEPVISRMREDAEFKAESLAFFESSVADCAVMLEKVKDLRESGPTPWYL